MLIVGVPFQRLSLHDMNQECCQRYHHCLVCRLCKPQSDVDFCVLQAFVPKFVWFSGDEDADNRG